MVKKLIFIFFLALLCVLSACSNQDDLFISENGDQNIATNPILERAISAYDACYSSSTRGQFRSFDESGIVPVTTLSSRALSSDTLFYIVNETEGNGFVAITGDSHPEILAVSDNGTITNIEDIENPGLKMFFNAATSYSSGRDTKGLVIPDDKIPYFKEELIMYRKQQVEPRCVTQWGQENPEGKFCPNGNAGCVAVAAAQALSYFEQPSFISLTYPNTDMSSISLDWTNLKEYASKSLKFTIDDPEYELKKECDQNLGRLCRELGHRMDALYLPGGTAIHINDMISVVNQLSPALQASKLYSGAPIAKDVMNDGIIIMQGTESNNTPEVSDYNHVWIIDGYIFFGERHNFYVYKNGEYVYNEDMSYDDVTDLQHINWGWNGVCNGYFNTNVYKTDSVITPDTNINSLSKDYSHSFYYCIIEPK